jgi:tetratricopeptide (TPR) repeat protein
MDELTRNLEEARRHVHAEWDDDHAALVLVGMRRRGQRRAVVRAIGGIAALVIAAFVGARFFAEESVAVPVRAMQLVDGSTITPLTLDSKLTLTGLAPDRIEVDFAAGKGSFDVLPNAERTFVVSSGDVRVMVIGTAFTLERREERTLVSVDRGRVRVEWTGGTRELSTGEAGWFPPETPDEAAELLKAADLARAAGNPSDAIPYLEKIVTQHERDPRAPLAAFTLGRLLLDLGRHREAAASFESAHRLDPAGSLAEDALVREVESWALAGDEARASARGEAYFAQYPHGRRAEDVRSLLR